MDFFQNASSKFCFTFCGCFAVVVVVVVVSGELLAVTEIPGGGGKRERYTLTLSCHSQNESCIKMGSDEGYFKVSLIVRGKVKRQRPYKKYTKCVIVYCGVVNVQPRFNFSDEIIR